MEQLSKNDTVIINDREITNFESDEETIVNTSYPPLIELVKKELNEKFGIPIQNIQEIAFEDGKINVKLIGSIETAMTTIKIDEV